MENLHELAQQLIGLAHEGFSTIDTVQGIIIAVIAALMMRRFSGFFGLAIAATFIHEIVNIARHAYYAGGHIALPDYTNPDVWKIIGLRFAGYLVAICLIYIIRRVLFRG
ncbi:MAG: hypothetical protein ACOH12_14205 [Parvibaculaceae bacterium]